VLPEHWDVAHSTKDQIYSIIGFNFTETKINLNNKYIHTTVPFGTHKKKQQHGHEI